MKLLLDTHALIWWLLDDMRLSRKADAAIGDRRNSIHVSAASAFEVTTKVRIGKLPEAASLAADFEEFCLAEGFAALPVSTAHAARGGTLGIPHKDPFDRILIAQAQIEDMLLISNEALFDGFGVRRLW